MEACRLPPSPAALEVKEGQTRILGARSRNHSVRLILFNTTSPECLPVPAGAVDGMRSEQAATMEEAPPGGAAAQGGPYPGQAPTPPSRLGAPYSEAWGYFHLAPARAGHAEGQWATCRLCGEQVSRGPGFREGTPALWRHLESAHRRDLEQSAARGSPPGCGPGLQPPAPGPGPTALAEGDWARLLEQMSALAVRGSLRERELARREAALEQGERALERGRRALREEERALARARRELRAEREALQARLLEVIRCEGAPAPDASPLQSPLKEEPEADGCIIRKVLL